MMSDDDPFADLVPIGSKDPKVVPFSRPESVDDVQTPPLSAYAGEVDPPEEPPPTWPTEYDFFNEAALPVRRWIYGRHYLRRFVSVLASAGGIGKTSLQIVEALAIVTGKPLLGETVHETCKVWLVNLEDPLEEMQRRVLAAMKHYGIKPDEVRGKLFVDAGREFQMKFATQSKLGPVPNKQLVEYLEKRIPELEIGAVFIDPFVGAHSVNENDNMAINTVVEQIRRVADTCECAINLVHHIRKGNGEDASIDSVRGAGSLIGAARAARVINRMSEDDALKFGIGPTEARSIFRVDDGKANLAPPADVAVYRQMHGVQIANGEWIGVAIGYELPDAFDGISVRDLITVQRCVDERCRAQNPARFSDQSGPDWAGHIIAETLGMDPDDDRKRIKKILSQWIKTGALQKAEFIDHKRMKRPIIEVGEWAHE